MPILVVDDDASTRALLQQVLEMAGNRVETAANGQEALHRLSGSDLPSVVLLD